MAIHFYKLQCGGNSFVLLDLTENVNKGKIKERFFATVAARLSSRRYGIGAVATIFLQENNFVRVFDKKGMEYTTPYDAFFCCARYLFDCGKISGSVIDISSPQNKTKMQILGAKEFVLNLGSPFSMETGLVIEPSSASSISYIETQEQTIPATAIHIIEDSVCAFGANIASLTFEQFKMRIQSALSPKKVNAVLIKAITQETLAIRSAFVGVSSVCASAASSAITGILAGTTAVESVVLFNPGLFSSSSYYFNSEFAPQGQEFAVSWNEAQNEIKIVGSGAYIFDGSFDLPDYSFLNSKE